VCLGLAVNPASPVVLHVGEVCSYSIIIGGVDLRGTVDLVHQALADCCCICVFQRVLHDTGVQSMIRSDSSSKNVCEATANLNTEWGVGNRY
jgi:hypothetical protein